MPAFLPDTSSISGVATSTLATAGSVSDAPLMAQGARMGWLRPA